MFVIVSVLSPFFCLLSGHSVRLVSPLFLFVSGFAPLVVGHCGLRWCNFSRLVFSRIKQPLVDINLICNESIVPKP